MSMNNLRRKILLIIFISVPSEAPDFFQVTGKTSTSILLSWRAPSKESINGILMGYCVSYHNNRERVTVDTASNQTNLVLNGLGKYTKYTITIAARTLQGPGEKSKPIIVTTDEDSKYLRICYDISYNLVNKTKFITEENKLYRQL